MISPGAGSVRMGTALTLGLSCVLLVGCSPDQAGQTLARGASSKPAAAKPPIAVQVSRAVPVDETTVYPSDLYVERDVWVTPRSTGIIEEVRVDRGQRVKQGQALVLLETDLQRVELQIAEQALRYHEAEFARTRELHQQNIVSALDALRDEIERDLAASELERAKALLERCTVRAPFEGIVVERLAVPGQRVLEEEATPLVRVVADDRMRARIHVSERDLAAISAGQAASIVSDGAASSTVHAARVVFVSTAVDAASDTALVIVEAERHDATLRVGAGVQVRLQETTGVQARLFRVPREALGSGRLIEGAPAKLLVAAEGRAAERQVDLIALHGTEVTVRGGLGPGDLIIVAGGARLAPGDAVEVRSQTP